MSERMNSLHARVAFRLRERMYSYLVSFPRSVFWRCLGLKLGVRTQLPKIHVTWPHQVSLGNDCTLEHGCYFKFDGVYRPGPLLVFGDNVFIGVGCEFNIRARLEVGANCLIASRCYFVDHDHGFSTRTIPMGEQTDGIEAPIVLEQDVWLGANVVVLKGVRIGQGAIIAAGSVVNKSVGAFEIWAGVPARKLRDRPPVAAGVDDVEGGG